MANPTGGGRQGSSSRSLSTLTTATTILETLMEVDGATVTDLADRLDMSKSSVYNYVTTLRDDGWLVKEGTTYHLGLKFFQVGNFVRANHILYSTARSEMERLAEETGETVHLSTEQHLHQIHLYKAHGEKAVGSEYHRQKLHKNSYLHDTATGKAILAYIPDERVDQIVDEQGLPAKTEQTITSREALHEELAAIRERGYAYNDEEEIEALRAVGAPVRDHAGRVLGSISVSGPKSRLRGDRFHEELPELVTRAANVIEVNINMEDRLSAGDLE